MTGAAAALIGTGVVRHRRLRPVDNAFAYRTYFLMLPMRRLRDARLRRAGAQPLRPAGLPRPRPWRRPRRRAGLAGRAAARAKASPMPTARSGCRPTRACWATSSSRSASGTATAPTARWRAIVVEVNNTFGERHCYLLAGEQLAYGTRPAGAQGVPCLALLPRRRAATASASCAAPGRRRAQRGAHRPRRRRRPAAADQPVAAAWQPLTPRQRRAALLRHAADDASASSPASTGRRCASGPSACPSCASRRRPSASSRAEPLSSREPAPMSRSTTAPSLALPESAPAAARAAFGLLRQLRTARSTCNCPTARRCASAAAPSASRARAMRLRNWNVCGAALRSRATSASPRASSTATGARPTWWRC